jgi:beta-xylosidase
MTDRTAPGLLRLLVALALAAGLLAGCEDADVGSPPATVSPAVEPTAPTGAPEATPDATADEGAPGEGEFQNPVLVRNFADPFVLEVDGVYYAYATGDLTYNIQVARSEDLVEWDHLGEALPRLPFWQPSAKGLTWAPEVLEVDGTYVMYYTARDVQAGLQCLAVAIAEAPEGPYVDESDEPFLCQYDEGGSIDAAPFVDTDGTAWLLWKNDGNCCGMPTRMYAQQLSDDGLELVGDIVDLGLRNDAPWEAHVIEAPSIIELDGTYYLFYSANSYDSADYAVGYATADDILGPYEKAEENPILTSEGSAAGPGHQDIIEGPDGEWWIVYHAWDADLVGDARGGRRSLWVDRLVFEDGRPVVQGPTDEPQPVP